MVMCDSSVADLNNRLDKPVSYTNFRPNLMVEGTKTFEEDTWSELFIGEKVHLRYVDKCTRCLITIIDPSTGIKDTNEQPLKELRRFRCMNPYGSKPIMAVHMAIDQEGKVKVAFQYFAPYMLMCDSSLGVLNGRLDEPVGCINFRPNIMIEGTEPFDENTWIEAFIGNEAHLRYVDNCTRCITVTLDPDTAIEDKHEQPLKELKRFRCREPYGRYKPAFGVYMAVENEGKIKVGDPVYVIKK